MVLVLAEEVRDELECGQLQLGDVLDEEGGDAERGDVEDGGVGEELHAHQVGQQRGQLVRLVVEGQDVPIPGREFLVGIMSEVEFEFWGT